MRRIGWTRRAVGPHRYHPRRSRNHKHQGYRWRARQPSAQRRGAQRHGCQSAGERQQCILSPNATRELFVVRARQPGSGWHAPARAQSLAKRSGQLRSVLSGVRWRADRHAAARSAPARHWHSSSVPICCCREKKAMPLKRHACRPQAIAATEQALCEGLARAATTAPRLFASPHGSNGAMQEAPRSRNRAGLCWGSGLPSSTFHCSSVFRSALCCF
jgi:hypothetical protein